MSRILQYGHRNPLDIIAEKYDWDYDVIAMMMTWAFGKDWVNQKAKDYIWKWNERHGRLNQYESFRDGEDPEKHFLYIAFCFKEKIAREQYALRKNAKFGKDCPCSSGKKFEKCCGDLLEQFKPGEGYTGPPKSKAKLVGDSIRLKKQPSEWRKGGLGWFKGKGEPTNEARD